MTLEKREREFGRDIETGQSLNRTIEVLDGQAYQRCRLGCLHTVNTQGYSADYEFGQHNCDHKEPLVLIFLEKGKGQVVCGLCGRAWEISNDAH